jgi:tetratricopeptide (TPR) repeat protein
MYAGLLRGTGPLLLLGAGVLVALALFEGEGSSYAPLVGIGGLALLGAGVGLALGFWGRLPLPRLAGASLAFAAFFVGVVVWMSLSVMWSVAPDRSWEYANRALVYLAFFAVGLVVGAWRPSLRSVAAGGGVLSIAVVGWALAGKVVPDLFPDGERVARLRDPLGYWNALALVAAFAILFGLWAASRREHREWARAAGAWAVFVSTIALLLTYSRGGAVVAAIVVAALIALVRERVQMLATLAVALPPALAISLWAFATDGIAANGQPYDERLEAGLVLGVLLLVGGALVVAAALQLVRYEQHAARVRLPSSRKVAVAAGAAAAVVLIVAVASGWAGQALDDFTNPPSAQGPGRFTSVSSSRRWEWWEESWRLFERDPVEGAGAGSFFIARRPYRTDLIVVVEPHNLPIQFLGELGIVGFALLVGLVGTGTAAVVAAVRRLSGAERAAATALALAPLAYFLHTLVDYDWDFVALTGPVLLLVGLLVSVGAPLLVRRRRVLPAVAAALLSVAAVASVAAPWLADREVRDAFAAVGRGEAAEARDAADRARSLNPLAVEPLFAAALAEETRSRQQEALELYVRAVELQPENSETWYQLARFEASVGLRDQAIRHVGQAQALDPKNEAIVQLIQELFAPPS